MWSYSDIFDQKQSILVVTAHPDDSVAFFGGLMHQLCLDKKEVFVLLVTNGARGSRETVISETDLAEKRLAEEKKALTLLGVSEKNIFCLGYADGEVESDLRLIGEVARYIRRCKADIVCTHEPSLIYLPTHDKAGFFVQHRDHRKVGEAVIDAVYPFARDRSFFRDHYSEGLQPHSVYSILLTNEKDGNFDFDFTPHLGLKKQALEQHVSQFSPAKVVTILSNFKSENKYLEKFNFINLVG